MAEEKSLHRMPVADCGDYEEIPLSQGASGNLLGLRSNPPTKDLVQACLSENVSKNLCTGCPSADCRAFEVGERSEVGALESSRNVNEVNHFREA